MILLNIFFILIDHFIVAIFVFLFGIVSYNRKKVYRNIVAYLNIRKECRVSFSCLLKINTENKYIIIRNLNRPEIFGPIGGVYKYFDTAYSFLSSIDFRPHQIGDKFLNDLRGFIPIEKLNKLVTWFNKGIDREIECITREIKEELIDEIGIPDFNLKKYTPKFRKVKLITEGPYIIKNKNYLQYRHIELYELISNNSENGKFVKMLIEVSLKNNNIKIVTLEEIKNRRVNDSRELIGTYCGYLYSNKRNGEEDIHY